MKKMKKQYCITCGKELPIIQEGFDWNTGKPKFHYDKCIIKNCDHDYHEWKKRFKFLYIYWECIKCGKTWYPPYDQC